MKRKKIGLSAKLLAAAACLLTAQTAFIYGSDYSSLVVVVDENASDTGQTPPDAGLASAGEQPGGEAGHEQEGMLSKPAEESGSLFGASEEPSVQPVYWDDSWPYASYSMIHSGNAVLYRPACGNGYVVCVNAGHGTEGGWNQQTLCHPDGSPKVTGGSTAEGAVYATAVSSGTTMIDGTPEAAVNLQLALILKDKLLENGFSVLMIREGDDVQLDNIARTVLANQYAACHLALHYDSTASGKGFFCMSVPSSASYRSMEPVASHYMEHENLIQALLYGVSQSGYPVFGEGVMEMDLTQTSYSTIPSVDVECGDTASDWSAAVQGVLADGLVTGLKRFFGLD